MSEYIEREAALRAFCATCRLSEQCERTGDRCTEYARISLVPAAIVRPVVRGNWVGIDDEPYTTWECDRCGCIYEEDFEYIPNFCPNCGADMRKEDE